MSEFARHAMYGGPALVAGVLLWLIAWAFRRWAPYSAPLWVGGGVLIGLSATIFGYMARPMPAPETRPLFAGVQYHRTVRRSPERAVVHFVRVELDAPGVEVFLTPGDPDETKQVRAEVTTEFLRTTGAQIAVNASYFYPFYSNTVLDYYPRRGDPVTAVGLTVAGGEAYAPPEPDPEAGLVPIWFFEDGHAELGAEPRDAPEAVSGFPLLVRGATTAWVPRLQPRRRAPRVAAGLEPGGRVLWLLVADGRQPLYSLGLDVFEVVEALRARGVHDAVMLDGGGSAGLGMLEDGAPKMLSTPVHGRIPTGIERPVANHIGIRARRL